jgi:quinol monooxygenase YgiN
MEHNMSKKIYCIASFKPKAGKEEAVFKALQTLEPNTHREDACLHYTVTRQRVIVKSGV